MARANTATLLSLDRFAQVVGIQPLHFNQVVVPDLADVRVCGLPIYQYGWQMADKIGREEIAQAIAQAEQVITDLLGFSPAPTYTYDERHLMAGSMGSLWPTVHLNSGYFIGGGIQQRAGLGHWPIVYTDSDGDGYYETATVDAVVGTITLPDEIAIFHPGHNGDDAWEIKPSSVTISDGAATIVFRREQAVREVLWESMGAGSLNGSTDSNFLQEVDVYRRYHDTSLMAQFLWAPETSPYGCSCSGTTDTCDICGVAAQYGLMTARDNKFSLAAVQPADWTGSGWSQGTFSMCRGPYRLRTWYAHGYRNMRLARPNVQMDPSFERAIAALALTYLDRPLCSCNSLENYTRYWREDLSLNYSNQSSSTSHTLSRNLLDNPIGMTRGAVNAWNLVKQRMLGDVAVDV